MADEEEHWCEVRVKLRVARLGELEPYDRIWYWLALAAKKKSPMNRDVHGPFEVVEVKGKKIKLKNGQGVALWLEGDAIIPLVLTSDPPTFG